MSAERAAQAVPHGPGVALQPRDRWMGQYACGGCHTVISGRCSMGTPTDNERSLGMLGRMPPSQPLSHIRPSKAAPSRRTPKCRLAEGVTGTIAQQLKPSIDLNRVWYAHRALAWEIGAGARRRSRRHPSHQRQAVVCESGRKGYAIAQVQPVDRSKRFHMAAKSEELELGASAREIGIYQCDAERAAE